MSFLYYLKKCGHQELGSIGEDGKPHRGRYLLTSMDPAILDFFPHLSTTQLNDSALIPIIPLDTCRKVYCNFVYHNDKYHGSTAKHPRNEYRLYLNKALENDEMLFKKDDIVVFRQASVDSIYSSDVDLSEHCEQIVYLMMLVQDKMSALYKELDNVIENYRIRGGYGLYDKRIDLFEAKADSLNLDNPVEVDIDNSVTERITSENHDEELIANLFNSASFRDFVLTGYGNLCAITGQVIRHENLMNLEAAHIKPRSHSGLYLPNNGIALCRDMHWAFDKGFFTINDDYTVRVHPKINSELLSSYNGKQIRLPNNPFFIPDINNLHYHQECIYGLFLTSGRL